ncbi:hypothetical protein PVAP13_6KG054270 [Panicum virgatum]|uniref:Uncharacterized protein n=1 Tax=Panicum virgatum TaxID=38727 RepID=A0A8T0R8D5_PANVG|nr:hypothetical protein PVAP13_6KG054270 [Panicum virgatum]
MNCSSSTAETRGTAVNRRRQEARRADPRQGTEPRLAARSSRRCRQPAPNQVRARTAGGAQMLADGSRVAADGGGGRTDARGRRGWGTADAGRVTGADEGPRQRPRRMEARGRARTSRRGWAPWTVEDGGRATEVGRAGGQPQQRPRRADEQRVGKRRIREGRRQNERPAAGDRQTTGGGEEKWDLGRER